MPSCHNPPPFIQAWDQHLETLESAPNGWVKVNTKLIVINLVFRKICFKVIASEEKIEVTKGKNVLQLFKNCGKIFRNFPQKSLTHSGSTAFGVTIIITIMLPQLIAVNTFNKNFFEFTMALMSRV